jgi:hypothetical protein
LLEQSTRRRQHAAALRRSDGKAKPKPLDPQASCLWSRFGARLSGAPINNEISRNAVIMDGKFESHSNKYDESNVNRPVVARLPRRLRERRGAGFAQIASKRPARNTGDL